MKKVEPKVLKLLRTAKEWSQEHLAEKTRLDKQTISRLERGDRPATRSRTIDQLARALNVDPAVLTGEAPVPEFPPHLDRFKLDDVLIGTAPRNALALVSHRYGIEQSRIVELAPFLFLWAAEQSLRQRRERITEVERTCEAARSAEGSILHLPGLTDFTYSEKKIAAEYESISRRDLFGVYIIQDANLDLDDFGLGIDTDTNNPFATFLRGLAGSISDVATFEEWDWSWSGAPWTPQYRVCPEEAAELAGDRDRADEIVDGLVALNEIPKELRQPEKSKERAEWVREKAEEYRRQLYRDMADRDALSGETERAT